VKLPNVDSLVEIMDMREAQRSYEADLSVMDSTKQMLAKTVDLLNKYGISKALVRLPGRLRVVRLGDPEERDLRRDLLTAPDRRIRVRALRVEVRGAHDHRADPRRGDHGRDLLDHGSGGDVGPP